MRVPDFVLPLGTDRGISVCKMVCNAWHSTLLPTHALDRNNGTRELPRTSNFSLLFLFSTTMKRSTTHNYDNNKPHNQFETPRKAKIQNAVKFYKKQGIKYFKNDIFRTFNISYIRGYQYLQNLNSNYKINNEDTRKT